MKIIIRVLAALAIVCTTLSPITAQADPAAPTITGVSSASLPGTAIDAAKVLVEWSFSPGAVNYLVNAKADGNTISLPGAGPLSNKLTFSNLTGGTQYSFTVIAQDNLGNNSAESAAVQFKAKSIPSDPTNVLAVAGVGSIQLTWTAPSNAGGLILGDYKITAVGADAATAVNTATSKTILNLAAGTTYQFLIQSTNDLGDSVGVTLEPISVPKNPGTPTNVSATASGSTISASWTAPASTGGSAITGYKVYLINASGGDVGSPLTPTGTNAQFTGVSADTYTVKVVATNIVGDSLRSTASTTVTINPPSSLLANDPVFTPTDFSDLELGAIVIFSVSALSGAIPTVTVTATPTGACTYVDATHTITGVSLGSCIVSASVVSNDTYNSGLTTKPFNVVKKAQTITFPEISTQILPGPLTVSATTTSGLAITISASGTCTALGTNISFTSVGSCTVTAAQAGNDLYAAASISRTFSITSQSTPGGDSQSTDSASAAAASAAAASAAAASAAAASAAAAAAADKAAADKAAADKAAADKAAADKAAADKAAADKAAAAKSSYFSISTSKTSSATLKLVSLKATTNSSVGKTIKITLPNVGSKSVLVKSSLRDPSGKLITLPSKLVAKGKSFSTPVIKFSKAGTYILSIYVGNTKRLVTIKVKK